MLQFLSMGCSLMRWFLSPPLPYIMISGFSLHLRFCCYRCRQRLLLLLCFSLVVCRAINGSSLCSRQSFLFPWVPVNCCQNQN
ncbi:hypothetical protein S83_001421 [Arachis hypogaea]